MTQNKTSKKDNVKIELCKNTELNFLFKPFCKIE